jgi:hypothetical protein
MGHQSVAHLLLIVQLHEKTAYPKRQAVVTGSENLWQGALAHVLQSVLGPKLLFFELLQLELLARSETQTAIEGLDALGKLSVLLFKVRLLSLCWDDSSLVLGHVTSEVLTGFSS